jgi:hypothetical protein
MASPDRKDDQRDAARSKQAALNTKNAKIFADKRKTRSDLYALAAKKADANFRESRKAKRYIDEDPNYTKSAMTKEEYLKNFPSTGLNEERGAASVYADSQTAKRRKANARIDRRQGAYWLDGGAKNKKKN